MNVALDFNQVEQLAPRIGVHDVPCPLCSAHHSPVVLVVGFFGSGARISTSQGSPARDAANVDGRATVVGEPPVLRPTVWPRLDVRPLNANSPSR